MDGLPWPASMRLIAEELSDEVAVKLAMDFGGTEIFVPKKPPANSRLVLSIGVENVQRLIAVIGHGHWSVPTCRAVFRQRRNQAVRRDATGLSLNALALRYGLHKKTISRIIHSAS